MHTETTTARFRLLEVGLLNMMKLSTQRFLLAACVVYSLLLGYGILLQSTQEPEPIIPGEEVNEAAIEFGPDAFSETTNPIKLQNSVYEEGDL